MKIFENVTGRYLSMAKCIIDQYNNYTVILEGLDDLKVNGIITQVSKKIIFAK